MPTGSPVALPLTDYNARAGFASPAEDFSGKRLDIAELLVERPQATFLLRVARPSMREYGIDDGDVIVLDRMLRARDGSIVVAVVDSMELAAETAAQVHRTVSNAVDADKWQHSRYLLNLNYDTGPPRPAPC